MSSAALPPLSLPSAQNFFIPPQSIMPAFKLDRATSVLTGSEFNPAKLMYCGLSYLTFGARMLTEKCISKETTHVFTVIEMLRRMPKKDKERMAARLEYLRRLPDFESMVRKTCKCLNTKLLGSGSDILQNADHDIYAWEGFTRNLIERTTVSSTILFQSVFATKKNPYIKAGSVKAMPCFLPNGSLDATAKRIIEDSFINKKGRIFNKSQRELFWKLVKQLPKSERQFLTAEGGPEFATSVIGQLEGYGRVHLPVLMCRSEEIEKIDAEPEIVFTQIVPSFGMMSAALQAFFGKNAIKMNPVFGISTGRDLKRNPFFRVMDCAIANRWYKNPSTADNNPALPWQYTLHDFYHSLISSGIPYEIAVLIIHIVLHLETCSAPNKDSEKNEVLEELRRSIIDMEFGAFRPDARKQFSNDYLCWRSLLDCFASIGMKNANKQAKANDWYMPGLTVFKDIKAQKKFEKAVKIETEQSVKLVIDFIFNSKLNEKAGITFDGLLQVSQRITKALEIKKEQHQYVTEEQAQVFEEKQNVVDEIKSIAARQKVLTKTKRVLSDQVGEASILIVQDINKKIRKLTHQLTRAKAQLAKLKQKVLNLEKTKAELEALMIEFTADLIILDLMVAHAQQK